MKNIKKRSYNASIKVENVKRSVDRQKEILIHGFSQGIDIFAEGTKAEIQYQIDQLTQSKSSKLSSEKKGSSNLSPVVNTDTNVDLSDIGGIIADIGGNILGFFNKSVGNIFRLGVKEGTSLIMSLSKSLPEVFPSSSNSNINEERKNSDPFIIEVKNNNDAQSIRKTINEFCGPLIQSFWLDTQDSLLRDGTTIREKLSLKIKNDIQEISNELSDYLGKALQVELNVNPIQFPAFEFKGIDAEIRRQQRALNVTKNESRQNCCNQTYEVPVTSKEPKDFYQIDLRQTIELINKKIDEQVSSNKVLLERVIEKQIASDFRKAEQQINDYIKKFQEDFDSLLKERETKEAESDKILNVLNLQKEKLNEYMQELKSIRQSLNIWKP